MPAPFSSSLTRAVTFMLALVVGMGVAVPSATAQTKFPDFNELIKDAEKITGLFTLHYNQKAQKLYMVIRRDQLSKEFLLPISIARGSGREFLGGDTLNFGDQWIVSFARNADNILLIRKNVRVTAQSGSPQADALKTSFTDSVVKAIPIRSELGAGDQMLIDLADLFMFDLADIGVNPDRSRSSWAKVKAFPDNVVVEINAVFSSGNRFFGDSATPDPRGAQIGIHYGISTLPTTDYKPRVADDRVGYFLTAVKDYSNDTSESKYKRYVARWNLKKADSAATLSPPVEPIVFWLEKTIPREYRRYIREGLEEWNKAFEKCGFAGAIEVRDQRAGDDFDPEDITFNTIRWITSDTPFAMGPSRWNPRTGQILDADILIDESMVRFTRNEYLRSVGLAESLALLKSGNKRAWIRQFGAEMPDLTGREEELSRLYDRLQASRAAATMPAGAGWGNGHRPTEFDPSGNLFGECTIGAGKQQQLNLMHALLAVENQLGPGGKVPEAFIGQMLKDLTMHEVGHTLGLRHNFKASLMLTNEQLHDKKIVAEKGLSGSVMDYLPTNFAPRGVEQGYYSSPTIGPYDYLAIEYAYKPIASDEEKELAKVAAKLAGENLHFGTDEDVSANPDPRINRWDLGDPLDFAKDRMVLVRSYIDDLAERVVADGEGWQRTRSAFGALLSEISNAAGHAVDYIGSEYTSRDHKGDPNGRLPFEPIPAAKQREALAFVASQILSEDSFEFSPELLRRLAPEHWGSMDSGSLGQINYQVSVPGIVLNIQRMVLAHILDADVLRAVQNTELHTAAGEDVVTIPELFTTLTDAVWSEIRPASEATRAADGLNRILAERFPDIQAKTTVQVENGVSATVTGWVKKKEQIGPVLDRIRTEIAGWKKVPEKDVVVISALLVEPPAKPMKKEPAKTDDKAKAEEKKDAPKSDEAKKDDAKAAEPKKDDAKKEEPKKDGDAKPAEGEKKADDKAAEPKPAEAKKEAAEPAKADKPAAVAKPADGKKVLAIGLYRRNLQREHVKRLSQMALGSSGGDFYSAMFFANSSSVPADARSLAQLHLRRLGEWIDAALKGEVDSYTRAHLEEVRTQIARVQEAKLSVGEP